MKKIIECIPNFSEGRDMGVMKQITDQIEAVEGVQLLDVDPGATTHRTVVTFVGEPDAVIEAAFLAIKKAGELIDMRKHSGSHPRMGATDVCPLVPISGVSVEEAVEYAHRLAKRVGEELGIPVFLYENAATTPTRKNLAVIRAGEYEGFSKKIYLPEWKPDYGPQEYNVFSGQTVIGVRDFLVAYNVNLNTQSVRRANSIAFDIRERGRVKTEDGKPSGKKVLDAEGNPIREPGACKYVKAIGWYVDEYGVAQVSANLTNIEETPVHVVFEEARKSANRRGLRVTGSELVGLIPKKSLVEAGRYYLKAQGMSHGMAERDLIHLAIKSLGLDELSPFDPDKKIIEYQLEASRPKGLADLTIRKFNDVLASDAPAPGGGSAAALVGALGASLGAMVANLAANKRGWEDRREAFGDWATIGQNLKEKLIAMIDEDTDAYNQVLAAYRLPKKTDEEKSARKDAIESANKGATLSPFRIIEIAFEAYELIEKVANDGNPSSASDAAVGALCIHTAIEAAGLNVKINLPGIEDKAFGKDLVEKVENYRNQSAEKKDAIMKVVESKL